MRRSLMLKRGVGTNQVYRKAINKLKAKRTTPVKRLTSMDLHHLANLLGVSFRRPSTIIKLSHAQAIELSKHGLKFPNEFIVQKLTKSSERRLRKR